MDFFKMFPKGLGIAALAAVLFAVQVCDNDLYGQSNRRGKRNNFSVGGRNMTFIRHGLTIHAGAGVSARLDQAVSIVPMAGLGYVASQYYGVGNRFMQQSVTYQMGLGMDHGGYQVHNAIGTFHCSYIGGIDLNPFVYGIALQFAYATKNNISNAYSNFYIRPEIGIAFPAQYKHRTKDIQRVTAMITYGFNIKTFYNYNPKMEREEYLGTDPAEKDVIYPFTAMCHHVITVRMNINFGNIREFRR
ncbi:MAG: hypothetical protein LBH82_06315 [Bacteroidales bacterium]|jgi:hypothetical protein|nr:hypothetical protein [Bacteroidales bacterium]